jgi:hypothetical protein
MQSAQNGNVRPSFVWLGPRWYAWLEFGPDNKHSTFVTIAQQVAVELGGTVIELLPNPSDDGKEYLEIAVGSAQLLLMRKTGLGIALGAAYPDVPLLLRIAKIYHAECRGWRWPFYRLWRCIAGLGAAACLAVARSSSW